jgi:uncharacterized membrane protein YdfJ with MMPL/SSD domain
VNRFVDRVGALVTRFPAAVLFVLFVLTVVLGSFATEQRFEADMSSFTPDGELQELDRRISEEFGRGERRAQVIVDAGRGGDVFSPEGLALAERLEDAIAAREDIAEVIDDAGPMGGNGIISYATPLAGQLRPMGMSPGEASQSFIDSARDDALAVLRGTASRPCCRRTSTASPRVAGSWSSTWIPRPAGTTSTARTSPSTRS